MYDRRCWNSLQLKQGDINTLQQKYLLVQDLTKEQVLAKIRTVLESCNAEKMEFSFELFSRFKNDSYQFDYDLRQICLVRSQYTCSTADKIRSEKAKRIGSF
jgi:hypothetical protein